MTENDIQAQQPIINPIENIKYQLKQEYRSLSELRNYINTTFLHCPEVIIHYSLENENLPISSYLEEIKQNLSLFQKLTLIFKFNKSINKFKDQQYKTIVGGHQKEFNIECDFTKKQITLILPYSQQFTFIESSLSQKYASQQSKFQNVEGKYLQSDLFETLILVNQIFPFSCLEFIVSRKFLPMQFYKIIEYCPNIKDFILTCGSTKIIISPQKQLIKLKLIFNERQIVQRISDILGSNISNQYNCILFLDYPPNKDEIEGLSSLKSVSAIKINLNVDNEMSQYQPILLFKFFQSLKKLRVLFIRCLPFPAAMRFSDEEFNSICKCLIKTRYLYNLYIDMNFSQIQLSRIARIEQKVNEKKKFIKIFTTWKTKYPNLNNMRWEIKFDIINHYLTESVRNLKPTIPIELIPPRKDPIYQEYYGMH